MIFQGYLHNLLQRERRKFAFSLQQLGFFTGKKFLSRISILWQVQKFAWLSPSWVKAIDISVLWPTYSWDLVVGILRQIRMGCCKYFNSFSPLRRMEWTTLVVDKDKSFKLFKLSASCSKVTGESTWLCFVLILKRDSTQMWINNLAKLLFCL